MTTIRIGPSRLCGDGERSYIAFEIGPTFTSFVTAARLVRIAAEAGADAIKWQILDPERLVGDDVVVRYQSIMGPREGSMLEILRRRVLTRAEWRDLTILAHECRLDVIATVDCPESLATAAGADALKICSGDVNYLAWIRDVARAVSLPIMLDTGHATLGEVEVAVDAVRAEGNAVIIHHVPGGYPARLESINLRVIPTLRQMFGDCVIAFSDHSPGRDMDVAAIALGAAMIEKTLTLDRTQDGPEHVFSLEPDEAKGFVEALRAVQVALGEPRRHLTEAERESKRNARRSLYAGANGGFEWRRPGGGIEPHQVNFPLPERSLPAGQRVRWEDLVDYDG